MTSTYFAPRIPVSIVALVISFAIGATTGKAQSEGLAGAAIRLDDATRARLGLVVKVLAADALPQVAQGYGRLLDPAVLAAPVYDFEATHAAFEAAEREYHRVETLQRGNANASQRDLEAARAALARERAAVRNAEARLAGTWGTRGAERSDLIALVSKLVAREVAVARVDLPFGTTFSGPPLTGRVTALADTTTAPRIATVLGPAPDADPTVQGLGFLLLVEHSPWPPGTAVTGWLALPGPPHPGVDVPRSALLRNAGQPCVYVQTGDDTFSRRSVHLDAPTAGGWFVTNGLAAGDRVVITGAQQLLSIDLGGPAEED